MAETALGALNSYKKELDQAKLTYEEAKRLLHAVDMFEVTISMIPSRGDQSKVVEMTGKNDSQEQNSGKAREDKDAQKRNSGIAASRNTNNPKGFKASTHVGRYIEDAANFVGEIVRDEVTQQVSTFIDSTPLGNIVTR